MKKTGCMVFLLVALNLYAQDSSFIIKNVRVFDGSLTINETNVVVKNGVINGIGPTLKVPDIPNIDGKGFTLVPGFLNAHAHTEYVDQLKESLRFGVTTVLDMGTFPEHDKTLRNAAASRKDVADFRSSGIFITPPGGHGTEYGYRIPTINNTPDKAKAFVDQRIKLGADYLKIVINGVRNKRNGTPTLDSATVHALIKAGHDHKKLVVAHIESTEDIQLAIEAGVDGLVHQWRDSGLRPDLANLIAANNVFVVAGDVAVIDGFLNGGPQLLLKDKKISPYLSERSIKELKKPMRALPGLSITPFMDGLRSLMEADVLLLSGSDAFTGNPRVVHGASYHRMLELFAEAGLPPARILQMSTSHVADVFDLTDRGRIKPGLIADLILINGDPTTDIKDTRKIVKIWRRGIEVNREP
ncbi:MAG: amidohydrolase family protein [Bacteroidota bacterium]